MGLLLVLRVGDRDGARGAMAITISPHVVVLAIETTESFVDMRRVIVAKCARSSLWVAHVVASMLMACRSMFVRAKLAAIGSVGAWRVVGDETDDALVKLHADLA